MGMLGDVVFCVDCDRARVSHLQSVPAGTADPRPEPPRRMAIKQDANRDPLCASCLDSRQARRRAAFMLHEARPPVPESQPSPAAPAAAPAPRKKRAAPKLAKPNPVPTPKRSVNRRALERRFVLLVVEIGFLRAQELLDELKRSARNAAGKKSRR